MNSNLLNLTYEIKLQDGEKLVLPKSLIDSVGAGHWVITVQPFTTANSLTPIRDHSAFLNGYAPSDEGLYHDYPRR